MRFIKRIEEAESYTAAIIGYKRINDGTYRIGINFGVGILLFQLYLWFFWSDKVRCFFSRHMELNYMRDDVCLCGKKKLFKE